VWKNVFKSASSHLDQATAHSASTDMSSRLDSRITMLRDEMDNKKRMLGM